MKKAFITGITGQDGAYLAKLLLEKGYAVCGAFRRTSDLHLNRLRALGIEDKIQFVPIELLELTNLYRTIEMIQPDEIYNLGAQSFVGLSFEQPVFTADVTALGPLRILEVIRTVNPKIKFYQASSSEMFGKVQETPQNEKTAFYPRSPYAVSKLFAHWITVNYRESYGLFACSGILFNHESPFRGLEFVTRKITYGLARLKQGLQDQIVLGTLDTWRDWGYAPEYVEAMWRMLQQPEPDDYVIATGESHSVREFISVAFQSVDIRLQWSGEGVHEVGIDSASGKVLIKMDPALLRPAEVIALRGDYSKAKAKLGWSPRTIFPQLVQIMVESDMRFVSEEQRP